VGWNSVASRSCVRRTCERTLLARRANTAWPRGIDGFFHILRTPVGNSGLAAPQRLDHADRGLHRTCGGGHAGAGEALPMDTSVTVSMTTGAGSLPSDFASAISATYGSQSGTLQYLQGERFDNYLEYTGSGEPVVFTVRGSQLLIAPTATGDVTLRYTARFTALSGTATSNSLLTLFPDAYLQGHWRTRTRTCRTQQRRRNTWPCSMRLCVGSEPTCSTTSTRRAFR